MDVFTPNKYRVSYDVKDYDGNTSETVYREVEVADTIPPVISLEGNHYYSRDWGEYMVLDILQRFTWRHKML